VVLIDSEEGFAVGCPALPGCWTQGQTREEALANIREAIALWLEVEKEDLHNPITMGHIAKAAGLTPDQFRALL